MENSRTANNTVDTLRRVGESEAPEEKPSVVFVTGGTRCNGAVAINLIVTQPSNLIVAFASSPIDHGFL
jgi:hypothetical protein